MTNLSNLSNKPRLTLKTFSGLVLLLGFIGFLDATYLTVKHYLGTPLNCSIFQGCGTVTTSQYATVAGIPVALLGSIYYLTVIILLITYLDCKNIKILSFFARLSLVGFLASLWFIFLQAFVIKAVCLYCLISAATSTLLFIFGMLYIIKLEKRPL